MQTLDPTNVAATPELDLTAAIRRALESSPEPLTLSKMRAALPSKLRTIGLEELAENLQRQVGAKALVQYPKYRSQQDRFWDRPMGVHIAYLLKEALAEKPLALSELRRKLPDYANAQAEEILNQDVQQGVLHRHPPAGNRGGPRFGVEPPSPKTYLKDELAEVFGRLEKLGFTQQQLRQSAFELLQEEEWAPGEIKLTPPGQDPVLYAAEDSMVASEVQPS